MIGEVISFSRMKGFGFIHPDSGTDDVFVFRTEIQDARFLVAGDIVEFTLGVRNGRNVATNVHVERNGGREEDR